MTYFVDKSSVVNTELIGKDTKIWQNCVVLKGAKIGENVNINAHCLIENQVILGNNVTIKSGVYLWDGLTIEDFVQVGPNVTFTNDKYPRAKQKFQLQKTLIKEGASIGGGSIVLGGITIGKYSMVGAGTLVSKDVPDYVLFYGNPGEGKGYVCECGEKIVFTGNQSKCKCNKEYKIGDNLVKRIK